MSIVTAYAVFVQLPSRRKLADPHEFAPCTYHSRMKRYFISRHPGAIEWAAAQDLRIDQFLPHLDPSIVRAGDVVMGSLPVNLAAQVCARNAAYWHLILELPAKLRGQELDAAELEPLGARIQPYDIKPIC